MPAVALHVFRQELPPHRPRRHHVVVAVVATPLGEVVGDVERGRRGRRVLVVDEVHLLRVVRFGSRVSRQDDHVRAEQVAVGEDQL